jgi:hypothetical protein
MGWNTTVLILNDAVHLIEGDKSFPGKLSQAIALAGAARGRRDGQVDVSIGNHLNGCTVVTKHHADQTALIAVGGNHATVVHQTFGNDKHHTAEGQERLLRDWAEAMGFRLVRKPKK